MKIVPVYQSGDDILVVHQLDFIEDEIVEDCLTICLSIKYHDHSPVIRGQNFLRFDCWEPIEKDERRKWAEKIEETMPLPAILEMEGLLGNPCKETMQKLNFIPPRLRN